MRKTHSFEVLGIGEFNEYPIKVKEDDYLIVNKKGEELVKKTLTIGVPSEYAYMDKSGNIYKKEDVFYDYKGKLVQKIDKTKKVDKFKVVDKSEAGDLLEVSTSFLLPTSDTTMDNFKDKITNEKALKFAYKKSSVGLKQYYAFVYMQDNVLVMVTGLGKRSEAIENFKGKMNDMINKNDGELEVVSANDVALSLD